MRKISRPSGGGTEDMKETNYTRTFLTAEDISEIIHRSPNYCYKLIAELNKELEKQGFIVIRARIPRKYFEQRCGVTIGEEEN